ncbi:MAG: hypothetical protein ABJF88_12865 [Rhodothermales bacterium]
MSRNLTVLVFAIATLVACNAEPDRAEPTVTEATVPDVRADTLIADPRPNTETDADPKAQALNVALDSLEAFVSVLARVEGPIAAWNQAEDAARLLRYLEQNRAAFALDMSEEEAMERYPAQIRRLNELEARRSAELRRIDRDGVAGRVLVEEMAKADAAAEAAGQ